MTTTRSSFHPADYVVFILSLFVSLAIGVFFAIRGNRDQGEYMTANRKLSLIPVAVSLQVSFLSAITILGIPAEIYTQGTEFFISEIGKGLGIGLTAVLFVPLFFPLECKSVYEYLELRYNSKAARLVGSFMIILNQILYLGVASFAPSVALQSVTGFPVWAAIIVCNTVAIIYTCVGGIKAVVWTDVFQACVMLGGMLAIAIQAGLKVGGLSEVFEINNQYGRLNFFTFDPDPTRRHSFWSLTIGYSLLWLSIYATSQTGFQRICNLPTQRKAAQAVLLNVVVSILVGGLAFLIGAELFAYYASKDCDLLGKKVIVDPNQVVPFFVMETLAYPAIPGIFMASLFAGSLSSISSALNSMTTLLWEDFFKLYFDTKWTEKTKMIFMRVAVVVLGCFGTAIALVAQSLKGTVMQMAVALIGSTGGPLLGMFMLGAIFPWANSKGAICGGVLSLGISVWFSLGSYFTGIPKDTFATPNGTCSEYISDHTTTNVSTRIVTPHVNTTVNENPAGKELSGLDKMYSVSYLWFTGIGMMATIILGLLISFVTGANSMHDVPTKYQIPLARRLICCLPMSWRNTMDCHRNFDSDDQNQQMPTDYPSKKTSAHDNNAFNFDDEKSKDEKLQAVKMKPIPVSSERL